MSILLQDFLNQLEHKRLYRLDLLTPNSLLGKDSMCFASLEEAIVVIRELENIGESWALNTLVPPLTTVKNQE